MRRRDFIGLIGSTTVAWPLAARAQQPNRVRQIGVLLGYRESDHDAQSWVSAFKQELGKLGWAEGSNIHIDVRWATADVLVQSVERGAKELVALQPDLILTVSTPATAAMVQQTRTIPIVFVLVGDPVGSGFECAMVCLPAAASHNFSVRLVAGSWRTPIYGIPPYSNQNTLGTG